jgi:hypothetical protein
MKRLRAVTADCPPPALDVDEPNRDRIADSEHSARGALADRDRSVSGVSVGVGTLAATLPVREAPTGSWLRDM